MTSTLPAAGTTTTGAGFAPGKFLCFQLSTADYGIAIGPVREILGLVDVTPLPRTPDCVLGVIHRRGRIMPVVDLRLRFGMAPGEPNGESCILVVEVGQAADRTFRVGCLVDAVRDVLSIDVEQFEAMPRCASAASDGIVGRAKWKDRVVILVDIERVIAEFDPTALVSGTPGSGS